MTNSRNSHPLPALLEAWREADRATERAKAAAEAARRAAAVAAETAAAVAETARSADETLAAAERARDVARRAAEEAERLSGEAQGENLSAAVAVTDAEDAAHRARDAFHDAESAAGVQPPADLVEEAYRAWRDGQQLLEELPAVAPDHETVRLTVIRLQETRNRLTATALMSQSELAANRAFVASARETIRAARERKS